MRVRLPSCILTLTAALLLLAGPLPAQTISGIVAGRVTDAQGKPQAAVAIVVSSVESGIKFTGNSDSQGYYRILEVPPGLYEARAFSSMPTAIHTNVRVDVNRTTAENFVLTPEEQHPITSAAPMTDQYSATMNSPFNEMQTVGIPVITRDVNNLALLAPGVESVRTFSFASTLVPFSVNGSRGRDNNFTIDSVDNNEPLFGGAASQFTNDEIFQEYSISSGDLKAEFGRNTGATINAITKSGSNNWHGTMFTYGQGDIFDALNGVEHRALLSSPEPFYENTIGTTLGGPIKKDRSYVFLSYQWTHLTDNLTDIYPVLSNYPATPADLAVLRGLPTNPGLQAYLETPSVARIPGLAGKTPCFFAAPPPANMGVQLYSRLNPCLVTPTAVPVDGGFVFGSPALSSNYNVFNDPNANAFNLRDHQLSGRFDQKINDANDLYTRYLFDDLASPLAPLASAGISAFSDTGLLPDWRTLLRQRTQSFLVDHRFRQAGGELNEFRLSYSRVAQNTGAFNAPADTLQRPSAIISDCFAGNGSAPQMGVPLTGCSPEGVGSNVGGANTIGGLGGQGSISAGAVTAGGLFPSAGDLITLGLDSTPSRIISNTYQLQDDYSFTRGKHNIKLGVNFARIQTNVLGIPDNNGFYIYGGQGFSRVAFGPLNGLQTFFNEGDCTNFVAFTATGGTCGDVVSRRLTDVLYNASGDPVSQGKNELPIYELSQFYFAQDDWRVLSNLTITLGIRYENYGQPINSVHDLNRAAPLVNTDNKDFGPRLGFAWDPWKNGKTVIRGGYGIGYDAPILNVPLLIWESGPVSPLVSADSIGLAQLQPNDFFPKSPLTLQDLQVPIAAGSFSNGSGNQFPAATTSGMVQGCSQQFDLYDFLAPLSGVAFPYLNNGPPGRSGFPSREFNSALQGPVNIPVTNCSAQDTVAKNLKNPYVQNFSLGIQRQLGSNFLFEVDYVGSKGTRLLQRVEKNPFQGWNGDCLPNLSEVLADFALSNFAVLGQCRLNRIDDSHGDITEVTNGGSSSYNALQASLTKRFSELKYFGNVTFTAAYTWSHLIDNTSEIFGPGFRTISPGDIEGGVMGARLPGVGFLFDPLANEPVEAVTPLAQTYDSTTDNERGNSSFDRRHRVVTSFLWEPFPKRNEWLRGWELAGVGTYQSGQPFSPLNASPLSPCSDSNGDGSVSNDRPDIGNPKLSNNVVALVNTLANPYCLPSGVPGPVDPATGTSTPVSLTYNIFKNGIPVATGVTPAQAMTMAHFVQRPLFVFSPSASLAAGGASLPGFTVNGNPNTTIGQFKGQVTGLQYSGTAGRNILVGPGIANLDLALYKTLSFGQSERYKLQLRWEVYDVLNHPNPGYFNGDPYIGNSSAATAFAYNFTRTGAAITGGIPENAIDAIDSTCAAPPTMTPCSSTGRKSNLTFLSTGGMNTSSRRMEFGLRFIF